MPTFFIAMIGDDITTQIREALKPITDEMGADIIEINYRRATGSIVLNILVDKAGGISIDECAEINNKLGEALEKNSLIDTRYILEVSSPGLDRPIKDDKDFERNMGNIIRVSMRAPMDGKNLFIGKLIGLNKDAIVIQPEEEIVVEIPRKDIAKCVKEVLIK